MLKNASYFPSKGVGISETHTFGTSSKCLCKSDVLLKCQIKRLKEGSALYVFFLIELSIKMELIVVEPFCVSYSYSPHVKEVYCGENGILRYVTRKKCKRCLKNLKSNESVVS